MIGCALALARRQRSSFVRRRLWNITRRNLEPQSSRGSWLTTFDNPPRANFNFHFALREMSDVESLDARREQGEYNTTI